MDRKSLIFACLKLSAFVLIIVVIMAGCGQKAMKNETASSPQSTPSATPEPQSNESDSSPVPTPAPSVEEIRKVKISLYFSDSNLEGIHRIEREIPEADAQDLPKIAVEESIKGPESEYADLAGIMPPGVMVEYIKDVDGVANISFSKEIKNANLGSSGEGALLEQLAMVLQ